VTSCWSLKTTQEFSALVSGMAADDDPSGSIAEIEAL